MPRLIARTRVKPPTVAVVALSSSALQATVTPPTAFSIASYVIEFSTDQATWETLSSASSATASKTGLNPNTTGYFRARAVDGIGTQSPYSATASGTTTAVTAGGAPSVSLAANGTTAFDVTITATPTAGRSIVQYVVQRSLDGTNWSNVTLTETDAASEAPARSTATANKEVNPATANGVTIFATIQAAFNSLNPGDVLDIAPGTYNEAVLLTRSGTAANRITVRAKDSQNPPVIAGGYTLPTGWNGTPGSACLFGAQAEYVTFDGIIMTGSNKFGILAGDCSNNGFFVSAPNTFYRGLRFVRCSVIGANNNLFRSINTDGLELYSCYMVDGERSAYRADGLLNIDNSWGAGCTLMGKNVTMIECSVGQCSGEGLHLGYHGAFGGGDGYAHIEATNVTIRNNRFFDCWSAPLYITNVDGGRIERNVIWHTNDTRYWYAAASGYPQYGMDIASESGNQLVAGFNGFIGARNLVICNNIVSNALQPFRFPNEQQQQTNNLQIYNNTFYRTIPGSAASVASVIKNSEPELSDITFQNNIVYDAVPAQMCREWLTPGGTWTRGRNLFSTTPPAALSGTGDVISASPGLTDPTYQPSGTYPAVSTFDTSKIQLLASSPAINAGIVTASVTTDFFGRQRPTSSGFYDIGAHSLSKVSPATYTDTGLTPLTTYFYRAQFVDSTGVTSPFSGAVSSATGTQSISVRVLNAKQYNNNTAANPTMTLSGTARPVAGRDLVIGLLAYYGSSNDPQSITDDRGTGNVYTKIDIGDAIDGVTKSSKATFYLCKNYQGAGDPTITVAQGAVTGKYVTWCAFEVQGLAASPVDANARGTNRGSTAGIDGSTSAAAPTTQAVNLVLVAASLEGLIADQQVQVPSGYTPIFTESNGLNNTCGGVAYRVTNAISTPTSQWSWADGTGRWHCVLVTLKGA